MTTTDYVVYSITGCQYCELAVEKLRARGETYVEVEVESDPNLAIGIVRQTGQRTWPQIFHNGEFVGGYTELKRYLQ